MSFPSIQTALNGGELSPDLFGRTDLEKYRKSCSTLRNFFASYRGGAASRAGTKFVGVCAQGNQGNANNVPPPRTIQFQFSATQGYVIEAGQNYFRFITDGAYITEAPMNITNISALGVVSAANSYANGHEVYLSGIQGMINLNNRSYILANVTGSTFTLVSTVTGQPINVSGYPAYISGGTAARIYAIPTPYAASDIALLKFVQSADVMSITHPSYPPYDLTRISNTNWTLTKTAFGSSLSSPNASNASQGCATTVLNFWYQFVATAVGSTGQESVASPVAYVLSCDQSLIAGSLTVNCASVENATSYNFYEGPVTFVPGTTGSTGTGSVVQGGLFGFVGTSFGPGIVLSNVTPDFTVTPPLHTNPFATSSLLSVNMTAQGSGYNNTATTATIVSPIGQNPVLIPVVIGGAIVWTNVQDGGAGLTGGEAVTFIDATSSGSGATATPVVGPSSGTYPSCVAYFQQRRFYANTNNNPDTYYASQPGAFTNMDTSIPVVDSDAIIGSPWSQQVNGIQWMINMPGGLVILTGLGAWQLSGGSGGFAVANAVTPASQVASPQAYNGVSPTVPPIVINYDILYVQERGSIVRNLSYNYFVNIYTGTDMTVLSNHLFTGYTISQWAWAEEPWKLVWTIRNDGVLLCMTFLKEQEVFSWSRNDTNGLFQSVCTVSEPPVNAPYFVVKRLIQNSDSTGAPTWVYMLERMDDRIWTDLEQAWCVDCGLQTTPTKPNATITLSSSAGVPTLQPPVVVYGGSNYSPTTFARLTDPTGSGATVLLTIAGGVVTGATLSGTLTGYTNPSIIVVDPTGAGGNAAITIASFNLTTITASSPVFANVAGQGKIGDVIRMNGQLMVVTQFVNSAWLIASVEKAFGLVIQDDPLATSVPAPSGQWSIATPITTVFGLDHLEGMEVSILADGSIETPQTVVNGSVSIAKPATLITVGLGYTCQLQTMYLDVPGPMTVQARRKEIDQVAVRVDHSGLPFDVGVNQPDASLQPNQANVPWTNMTAQQGPLSGPTPLQPYQFFTGDVWTNVADQLGFDQGQIAVQQTEPVPLNITAIVNWARIGDDADDGS